MKYKNLAGVRFGRYTILNNGYISNKNRRVPVRCDCGTEKEVYLQSMIRQKSLSCGCQSAEMASERMRLSSFRVTLEYGIAARNALLSQYKGKARERNYEWKITDNEFFELTKGNCYYCGIEPTSVKNTGYKTGSYIYNGIDRKDNKIGYVENNVLSCCGTCNVAKNTMGFEQFKKWIDTVNKRINNGNSNT